MLSTQGKLLLALIQYIQAEITKFLDISLSLWIDFFSSPLFHCGYGSLLSLLSGRFLHPLHNSYPLIPAWCHTAVASNSLSTFQE